MAAFLWAQLEDADAITRERLATWQRYHALLEPLEAKGYLRRPIVAQGCEHNAHMYYVLVAEDNAVNQDVACSMLELLDWRPDFVISGINAGLNTGVYLFYSGIGRHAVYHELALAGVYQ